MRGFSIVLAAIIAMAASQFTVAVGERLHVVDYGDTLWELSIRYYGTPFLWQDILEANPDLEGVEFLMPGDVLVLPYIGAQQTADTVDGGLYTTSGATHRPILSRLVLETAGMISDEEPDPAGYVIQTNPDEESMFGDHVAFPGDYVALDIGQDEGLEVGRAYRVFEVGEEVEHPETGERLGRIHRAVGVCSVTEVNPDACMAIVEHSYLPVETGQYVMPYTSIAPITVTSSEVVEEMDAWVVGFRDKHTLRAYTFDVVYIDRGSNDGLQPGDMFEMFHYGERVETPDGETVTVPDVSISQMIVLDTRTETSAAMIITNTDAALIDIGDHVELTRRQN